MYIHLLDSLVWGGAIKCTSCFNASFQNLSCTLCHFDTLKEVAMVVVVVVVGFVALEYCGNCKCKKRQKNLEYCGNLQV